MATHSVELAPGQVVKRFTSWDRGEHEREWLLLRRRPHSSAVLTQAIRVLALADQAR